MENRESAPCSSATKGESREVGSKTSLGERPERTRAGVPDRRIRSERKLLEINPMRLCADEDFLQRVQDRAEAWEARGGPGRLWEGDESLWTSSGESKWLGWLTAIDRQLENLAELQAFAERVRGRYSHAVLLGMGGSSLCPEVLRLCFGQQPGFPDLQVLDSTDPAQIQACADSVELETTLFLAASKSGSTLETALLTQYFLDCLTERLGARNAADRFVAITDPGSRLEERARSLGFGQVFRGDPAIGGRYSALSPFGLVPAAAMGLDVEALLRSARVMQGECAHSDRASKFNPGVVLGSLLGTAALEGRDKLTILATPGAAAFGAWIEQLIAESTGKDGQGIVPVVGEPGAAPDQYGRDRIFVALHIGSDYARAQEETLAAFSERGHPVASILIQSPRELAQEFFRWECATAVAGSHLGINPFDQPDVEASKIAAKSLADAYEASGVLPGEEPFFKRDGIELFASPDQAKRIQEAAGALSLDALIRAHLDTSGTGDYVALLAYLQRSAAMEAQLGRMRASVLRRTSLATCLGFGPRFLHSTGQLHKGGANNGVFIQIDCEDAEDLPVPGRNASFGVVKAAQARGDFQVLAKTGRRALRVHVDGELAPGLQRLEQAFLQAAQ